MPPWWAQPNEPEKAKENTVEPESVVADEPLTEEDRRKAWRLLALLDSLRHMRPDDPVSLDEIDLLGRVAAGHHDLHDACAALRNGCSLEHLALIFT